VADPIFGFEVPKSCDGVPAGVLDPASSWPSRDTYMTKYRELAGRFVENFRKFEADTPAEVMRAGPQTQGSVPQGDLYRHLR